MNEFWTVLLLTFHSGEYVLQVHPDTMTCGDFLVEMYQPEIHEMGQCIMTEYPSGAPMHEWVAPPPPRPEELG